MELVRSSDLSNQNLSERFEYRVYILKPEKLAVLLNRVDARLSERKLTASVVRAAYRDVGVSQSG